MTAIYAFIIKSIIISGVLTGWYWLALRRTKLHRYNRAFLLFALVAALVLPMLRLQWFTIPAPITNIAGSMPLVSNAVSGSNAVALSPAMPAAATPFPWGVAGLWFIAVIGLLLLARLAINIWSVLRLAARYPHTRSGSAIILHTDLPHAPFSFFNYLFWQNSMPADAANGRIIFRHELVHIRQRHSVDRLFSQLLTCICWFNPFFWLIRKELELVHEYLADEQSIDGNDTTTFAIMMLGAHSYGRNMLPQHNFFSSSIKQRLTMLQKNNRTTYASLRRLTVLPVFAGLLCIFSIAPAARNLAAPPGKKLVLVVDAGHGGSDVGAGSTTYLEKHIVLQIAKRLKELAPQHNIDVQLTRSGDDNVILANRVAMANRLSPDAFITLHIGSDRNADTHTDQLQVGVAVAEGNKQLPRSIELGKSVYGKVLLTGNVKKNPQPYNVEKGLYVCRESKAPAILIELGDINNPTQMARLTDNKKVDDLCEAILNGVASAPAY